MATGVQVVFDCADPDGLARFWAEALGWCPATGRSQADRPDAGDRAWRPQWTLRPGAATITTGRRGARMARISEVQGDPLLGQSSGHWSGRPASERRAVSGRERRSWVIVRALSIAGWWTLALVDVGWTPGAHELDAGRS
jgi:hypothetical protein